MLFFKKGRVHQDGLLFSLKYRASPSRALVTLINYVQNFSFPWEKIGPEKFRNDFHRCSACGLHISQPRKARRQSMQSPGFNRLRMDSRQV